MKWPVLRVRVVGLALELRILELVSVQGPRNVHILCPHAHHVLPVQELLRDHRRQPAEQVAFTNQRRPLS